MKKKKVFLIFGTRPEAIKMYPVYKELKKYKEINTKIVITSQHQEMLKQVLDIFDMKANYDLNVMEDRQTLTKITIKVLNGLKKIFDKEKPDLVLVHGDTTTTFSAALAAFYEKIPIGHVEAGLRTHNKFFPYPEEINRTLTDTLADLHFVPTNSTRKNLLKEGISEESIFVTGNTIVDAVQEVLNLKTDTATSSVKNNEKFIIVTAHRRENWGKPMQNICEAIDFVSKKHKIQFIFSVHKNPLVRKTVKNVLGKNKYIKLMEPMSYVDFIPLVAKSLFILTDSGGMQEEAPSLHKPVLLLRNVTERPEAADSGIVKIIGTEKENIIKNIESLLDNKEIVSKMSHIKNPFGDGKSGKRIATIVKNFLTEENTYGIL